MESLTVGQLANLGGINPRAALTGRQLLANSAEYDEFVTVLYMTLDSCLRIIEEDPKVRSEDGEDRLTSEIITSLRMAGYDASHDATVGGHSDIVVKSLKGDCWVGESKIHKDYKYIESGWNQLTSRYLRGTPGYDQGGLLLYIRNQDCKSVIDTWRKNITELSLKDLTLTDCPTRKELGFYSNHKHQDSGRDVRVRHIGINLCWNPKP